jgi:diguanylate cyclase (GGDEF)-like protein/PAS domain S-box-containing protein
VRFRRVGGGHVGARSWWWVREWGGVLTLAMGGYGLVYLLWLACGWGGDDAHTLISDLAYLPVTLTAAALAFRASTHRRLDAQTRRAWRRLALAYFCTWVGDLLYFTLEIVLHIPPFPSVADVAYLSFYPLALLSLLTFPSAIQTHVRKLKFGLDAAIMVLGGGIVIWHFVLRPQAIAAQDVSLDGVVSLLYTTGDLAVFTGVVTVLLRRTTGQSRHALAFLLGGLVLFLCADVTYGYLNAQNAYQSGGLPDVFWMIADVLMLTSGQVQYWLASREPEQVPEREDGAVRAFSALPYAAIAAAYGLLVLVARDEWGTPVGDLIIGAVCLTGLVVARQVTALRENARLLAETGARQSEARFRSLIQNSSDVITVVQADGLITYQAPSIQRIFGHTPAEVSGTSLIELLHPEDRDAALAFVAEATRRPGVTAPTEWRLRHRDGSWRYVESVGTNLVDDPTVGGVVLNIRDVHEHKTLRHQAFHDPLTNLANRAMFLERVRHRLAQRGADEQMMTLLFLDLDNFKHVNDTLGHAAGDEVLRVLGDRLRACLRAGDVAARLGGDEFGVLVEDTLDAESAAQLAGRITAAASRPMRVHGTPVQVGASVGIVLGAPAGRDAEQLLREADAAMYRAKSRGKGRYEFSAAPMRRRADAGRSGLIAEAA